MDNCLQKFRVNLQKGDQPAMKKCILVSGGSFCPIHVQHVEMFHLARQQLLEQHQILVVAGFLIITEDSWILKKLEKNGKSQRELIPFERRLELAKIACSDSDIVSPYPVAAFDAGKISRKLEQELQIPAFMLCGADLLVRKAYQRYKIVAVPREGIKFDHCIEERARIGVATYVIDARSSGAAVGFSSTRCRELMQAGDWATLVYTGMLHQGVAEQLRQWAH